MKLLLITAIKEFESEIKNILVKSIQDTEKAMALYLSGLDEKKKKKIREGL